MSKSPLHRSVILAFATMLSAGAAGAAQPPASSIPVPERFAGVASPWDTAGVGDADFWRGFGDPMLSSLVERALAHNTDLRGGFARLQAANALLRGARLERLPSVRAEASASRSHLSADQRVGTPPDAGDDVDSYQVGARVSWELDLFGRVRQDVEAQRQDTLAQSQDLQALQVVIVAAVVRDYFELRGLQVRLGVAQDNESSQRDTLRLVEAELAAGRGTDFDSTRARAQYLGTRARVPALQAQIAVKSHRLAVLTGQTPDALLTSLSVASALPTLPAPMDPGTPADLLRRRPDVAAAEARLAAAVSRVGVARADLFPRFTLGGLFGSQAADSGGLLGTGSASRLVTLGIDWSFLDFGRVRARLSAARAHVDGELADYEGAILNALEETENALVRYTRSRQQDEDLTRAAVDAATAANLARARYEAGVIGLLEVLEAERVSLQAQDAAAQARIDSTTALVDIYRVLSGGWPNRVPDSGIAKSP